MTKKISNKKLTWILVAVFVVISFYPLFAFLGTQTLRTWDESRVAASSYEMTKTKNPLIVTFDYQPDHWSVKPPLAIWLEALSIKAFGVNEAAVRLPSAIAIMLLGIVIILLTGVINKPFLGFYSASVMICSKGVLFYHTGRSADYDALLCLFMISYLLLFFIYTETKEKKYYKLFFVFLILATLTKGVQALLPLPFIPIYALCRKQLMPLLKDKTTYIGIGLFVLFVGGYYIARELSYGGYLKAVYYNELGGRLLTVIEGHHGGKDYYYNVIKKDYFTYFLPLLPLAFIFNFFIRDKQVKRFSLFAISNAILIFIVITIVKTKIDWYVLPLMPLFGMVIGTSFYVIHNWILILKKKIPEVVALIVVGYISVFFTPYVEIVKHVFSPIEAHDYHPYYSRLELMKKMINKEFTLEEPIVYMDSDNLQDYMFYFHAMNHYGIKAIRKEIKNLQVGDVVQINEPKTDEIISSRFEYEGIYVHIQSKLVRLKSIKENIEK